MTFQPRELFPDRSARDLFGSELRRLREKADMSLRRLAEVLNYSKSHLVRIEAAESLPYDDLPSKLDVCFGTDGLFGRLYALARNEPFHYRMRRVVEIEKRALSIAQYSCATVPGLLQTAELAAASLRIGNRHAPDAEIDAMVRARIGRQALLDEPRPPHCWFILDEAVLRRQAGEREVMRKQMLSLIERGTRSHVILQVLPFRAGQHVEAGGSMTIYTMPDEPTMAYEEGSRFGTIIEDRNAVAELQENYDLLRAMALSPRDSEALIGAAIEEWAS